MNMRKVDVYTNNILINDEPVRGVLEIITPSPGNGDKPASITLAVDGAITYHNTTMPIVLTDTQAKPYDFAEDYRKLVERLTVLVQKGHFSQERYDSILRGLYKI